MNTVFNRFILATTFSLLVTFTSLLGLAKNDLPILKAGVAKTIITNREPRIMTNGRLSTGVLKDIYARALVLNDGLHRLVIITYDLNCLDVATPILRARLAKEMGIESKYLILLATHNHNAPIQIIPENFDYGRWLADTLVDLVREAIQKEDGPIRLHFGSGPGYFITASGNAPVDYEIQVLRVTMNGKPIALLFNQGTHPLQASLDKIGPGHPGYAMDMLETSFPGMQAMYADASGGNQYPRMRAVLRRELNQEKDRGIEYANRILSKHTQALARKLADAVLEISNGSMQDVTGPLKSRLEVLSLPLGPPISETKARALAEKYPDGLGLVPYPNKHRGTNWVRELLYWYEKGLDFPTTTTEMVATDDTYIWLKSDQEMLGLYKNSIHETLPCVFEEVLVAQIGPMPLVAMQGEICAPIGMRIKDAFRHEMPIMVFGYMGEHNLYIPTRELVRLKAYQAKVIQTQYGSPVGWSPEVEDEMVSGVIQLVNSSLDRPGISLNVRTGKKNGSEIE